MNNYVKKYFVTNQFSQVDSFPIRETQILKNFSEINLKDNWTSEELISRIIWLGTGMRLCSTMTSVKLLILFIGQFILNSVHLHPTNSNKLWIIIRLFQNNYLGLVAIRSQLMSYLIFSMFKCNPRFLRSRGICIINHKKVEKKVGAQQLV